MILVFNNINRKYISLFVVILIFFMSFFISTSVEFKEKISIKNNLDNISNVNIADLSYELLVFENRILQNRFKDRNLKITINDKLIMLFTFFGVNNSHKFKCNSILESVYNTKFSHDMILSYIHAKDGKK